MSKYFRGYYCKDKESIEGIKNENERKVLEAISSSYPHGIARDELHERTGISENTIYGSLDRLGRSGFIKKEEREGHFKHGQKSAFTYYIENKNFALNEEEGFVYQFAPGSVQYSSEFLETWEMLIDKTQQNNIYSLLINLLRSMFTIINGSNDTSIRNMRPKTESFWGPHVVTMHCRYCGLNHEARDFIRAVLLHFIDRFEISYDYIEFLKSQNLLSSKGYELYQKASKNFQPRVKADKDNKKEEALKWFNTLGKRNKKLIEIILSSKRTLSIEQIFDSVQQQIKHMPHDVRNDAVVSIFLENIGDNFGIKDLLQNVSL